MDNDRNFFEIRDRIWQTLFYPPTSLFYDYPADGKYLTEKLPTVEEIALQIPNPCGWGTGMEDSMLNAGNMLLASLNSYDIDPQERFAENARQCFKGMELCATVSDSIGFLARSVSPADGKSYYINSSRDQYTHFIYSAYRYYNHKLCSEGEKHSIRRILCNFAERAIKYVTPENNYDLMRADGRKGQVIRMYGEVGPHEAYRLGMFYLGAWHVSGDEKYLNVYIKHREHMMNVTEKIIDFDRDWFSYALLQMQYSLRMCYELEIDEKFKARMLNVMQATAEYSRKYAAAVSEMVENNKIRFDLFNPQWRQRDLKYVDFFAGYAYNVPSFDEDFMNYNFRPQRICGEGILIQYLCPNFIIDAENIEVLKKLGEKVAANKIYSYGPIVLLDAYYSVLKQQSKK